MDERLTRDFWTVFKHSDLKEAPTNEETMRRMLGDGLAIWDAVCRMQKNADDYYGCYGGWPTADLRCHEICMETQEKRYCSIMASNAFKYINRYLAGETVDKVLADIEEYTRNYYTTPHKLAC